MLRSISLGSIFSLVSLVYAYQGLFDVLQGMVNLVSNLVSLSFFRIMGLPCTFPRLANTMSFSTTRFEITYAPLLKSTFTCEVKTLIYEIKR